MPRANFNDDQATYLTHHISASTLTRIEITACSEVARKFVRYEKIAAASHDNETHSLRQERSMALSSFDQQQFGLPLFTMLFTVFWKINLVDTGSGGPGNAQGVRILGRGHHNPGISISQDGILNMWFGIPVEVDATLGLYSEGSNSSVPVDLRFWRATVPLPHCHHYHPKTSSAKPHQYA